MYNKLRNYKMRTRRYYLIFLIFTPGRLISSMFVGLPVSLALLPFFPRTEFSVRIFNIRMIPEHT